MATPAQITANRLNALKSTGPRSPEGKSASRFNALKHGLDAATTVIPCEDPAVYDALAAHYRAEFRPKSPSETFHIETMLRADWQKRRLARVEADLHRTILDESPGASLAAALLAESPATHLLARIQRQIAAFERTWHRANNELRRARHQAESSADQAFTNYLDALCTMPDLPELASFGQSAPTDLPDTPSSPADARPAPPSSPSPNRPPTLEKPARPAFFVG